MRQYSEAFPGREATLAAELDPVIDARWAALLSEGVRPPVGAATREEWLIVAQETNLLREP